jgi:copper transport protein
MRGGQLHRGRAQRGPSVRAVVARLLLVVGALFGLGAPPAGAHADLVRSDPPNGGMIASGRSTVTLWFGEEITPAGSSFTVQRTDGAAPAVETSAEVDADATVVHVELPPLENAAYTLTWAVTSTDGHPTRGTVVFGVGFRPDGIAAVDTSAPDPAGVALRTADLGGAILALGALVVAGRVVSALGGLGPRLRRRVLLCGAAGATLAVGAALLAPVLPAGTALGDGPTDVADLVSTVRDLVLTSTWGALWVVRVVSLAVACVMLWWAQRQAAAAVASGGGAHRWRTAGQVSAAALVLAVSVDAWAGHAAALPSRSAVAAVAAALHVVAASVWAGGLLVLVLSAVPLMRLDRPERRLLVPAVWRSFSPVAAVSASVLVATGVYEATRHTGTVVAVADTSYGRAVLAKVLLLGVALALAAYNTLVVNAGLAARVGRAVGLGGAWRPRSRPLAITVTVEALVLLLAVGLAAFMTSTPTGREVQAARSVTAPHTDMTDGLFVTAEVVPTGSTMRVVVRTEAVQRPLEHPVEAVSVRFVPDTLLAPSGATTGATTLDVVDDGRFETSVPDPGLDRWTAEVVVLRQGAPEQVLLLPGSSATGEPVTPLELAGAAFAVLLLAGTATAVVVVRRRAGAHRVRAHPDPLVGPPEAGADPQVTPVEEASTR